MISYEELCQALDRFNHRLRNEAELNQLNAESEPPVASAPTMFPTEEEPDDGAGLAPEEQVHEDTHEIDVVEDDMVLEEK